MKNMPVPVTKETLVGILEDILAHVREDDSWEGSLEYLMPVTAPYGTDPEVTKSGEPAEFMLQAAYRIGNTGGQGGMRLFGEMR